MAADTTKETVDLIISAMESRPETFTCEGVRFRDRRTNMVCATGFPYRVGIHEPYVHHFGFFQGRRFIRAVNEWKVCRMRQVHNEILLKQEVR